MTTRPPAESNCPATILAWIPWYPDELGSEQRGAVETHAAVCRECRRELALLRGDEVDSAAVPDPERVYARVLARIESEGSLLAAAQPHTRPASLSPRAAQTDRQWQPLALAASLALALLAGGVVGAFLTSRTEPIYRTASSGTTAIPTGGPGAGLVEVVFREDAEMTRISETLRALEAQIASGPSPLGRYRVELTGDVDPAAAAVVLRSDLDGVAIFAEPVP